MEGGVIQNIVADGEVDVRVIDYDAEDGGCEARDPIVKVPQEDPGEPRDPESDLNAFCADWKVSNSHTNGEETEPGFVEKIFGLNVEGDAK